MSDNGFLSFVVSVLRLALYPFTLIYGALVWVRNRMYDINFYSSISFSVPVISVGNLSTGGTGKTPHIEYLIELLQYQFQVATMSRGYKRFTKGFIIADEKANALRIGDEPMQFFMKYPEAIVCVAEERLTGIPNLLQRRPGIDIILLDDAYQHRSVKAGLNILITDYSHPFYNDHILPFGNLRESRSAYKRADVIIVSKCPVNLSASDAKLITIQIKPLPNQKVFFTAITYGIPYSLITGDAVDIAGTNAVLVCGIARPEPLIAFLQQQVADVHTLTYADHHYFVTTDLDEMKTAYDNWSKPNKIIVTTEKDAARLHLHKEQLVAWGINIVVMPIKISVLFNETNEFNAKVMHYIYGEIGGDGTEADVNYIG